ncbi:MAG: Unknown protein [uncultured Sulfurovum sp.]|uniref:Uncharacterized protein n=1 Tax=uncultured Sulfurovum sp. TaxID=269237 RepID=A0A6S6U5B4_9BACT|nr:MAG: Unknown protein [uncultured Sulfurovum sp.]
MMSERIETLLNELESIKMKLKEEIEEQERHISYEVHNGCVKFQNDVIEKQKKNMKHLFSWFKDIPLLHLLSSPLVYAMVIPALFLDLMLYIYQKVVFAIYKFKPIKRSDYIVFDRQYLAYLNPIEKINCLYCSYFNGLMQYASAIAGRSELYFCPIKHAKKMAYAHKHYYEFFAYGDEVDYQERLETLRKHSKDNDADKKR